MLETHLNGRSWKADQGRQRDRMNRFRAVALGGGLVGQGPGRAIFRFFRDFPLAMFP